MTRNISIQMAPQIRLIQSSNQLMAEKIQTSLNNTIPLWKSQMVLALGLAHTQSAMEAQRAVSDLTNELLRKNAEKLKMATTESAKEAERGIVDIETLQQTNQMLIDTMDEVLTIQQEGRQKRQAAEGQLKVIENDLRNKLLSCASKQEDMACVFPKTASWPRWYWSSAYSPASSFLAAAGCATSVTTSCRCFPTARTRPSPCATAWRPTCSAARAGQAPWRNRA